MLLKTKYSTVYPGGTVQIGGAKYFKFQAQGNLTGPQAIQRFLPAGSTPAAISNSKTNPQTSDGSVFAAQVLALRLNVDFSNSGVLPSGLSNLKLNTTKLSGWKVFDVLSLANLVLGGNPPPAGISISDLNFSVTTINENFDNGGNKGNLVP